MLLKKRKTEEFHFTPEQEACLARCRELTNDELRILNGGGSYKGMPSSTNNSSPSESTESGSSGNGSSPFPKPYAGAYEHGSYAEAQKETEKQKAQEVQAEQVPQADTSEVQHKGVRGFFKRMFGNDGKKTIHTFGAVASATWITGSEAVNAGVYVDPKNDFLYAISERLLESVNPIEKIAGSAIFAMNIDHMGVYGAGEAGLGYGASASVCAEFGTYKSLEDFQGAYYVFGGSVSEIGIGGAVILSLIRI